jgi:hypothetical protein
MSSESVINHFKKVAEAIDIGIVIHLYPYITKTEHIKLATNIKGLVVNSKKKKKNQSSLVYGSESINYWGVNIVSRIEAKKPISRMAVYAHPIRNEVVANAQNKLPDTNDPFIYNPFAKKVDTDVRSLLRLKYIEYAYTY